MGRRGAIGAVALAVAAFAASPAFGAAKLVNPGEITFTSTGGYVHLGEYGDPEAFAGDEAVVAPGTADADGNLLFPESQITWPTIESEPLPESADGVIRQWSLAVDPVADATGMVDPATGLATLDVQVSVTVSASFSADVGLVTPLEGTIECEIGSATAPIALTLSTARSEIERIDPGTGRDETLSGVPYNQQTGGLTLLDDTFTTPAISDEDCDLGGGFAVDFAPFLLPFLVDHIESGDVGSNVVSMQAKLAPVLKAPHQKGTAKRDVMTGTQYAEKISGRGGNDTIKPLGGKDKVFAGSGKDKVRARDGKRDTIDCGKGRDVVYADKRDKVARNCERVRRA